jgi:hypothetical protein
MSELHNYLKLAEEKNKSQNAYAKNISLLPAELARGCSYGRVRVAKNSLIRIVPR